MITKMACSRSEWSARKIIQPEMHKFARMEILNLLFLSEQLGDFLTLKKFDFYEISILEKKMKFSISLTSGTDRPISSNEILAFAKRAELLGYHGIYVTDHFFHDYPNFHSVSASAVLCAATENIRIGFSAYQVPLRHPIIVAKEFAMLDALSKGRLVSAFAAGSYAKEFEALGVPFNKRGKMLDEAICAIKKLWKEDNASFRGEFWSFENVTLVPKPVQKPGMPIWIASWSGGAGQRPELQSLVMAGKHRDCTLPLNS